jgi:Lrp/AsnC family transcriptional regulator, leucine-responsive regulatory protein
MSFSLDDTDLQILSHLQKDSCLANVELAKRVGMAPSAVLERVKKLEQKGIILNYPTRINPDALDLRLLAFIFIKSNQGLNNVSLDKELAKLPEVLELHHIAGEDCYIAKVRVKDPQSLAELIRRKFSKIKGIHSTKTTVVLETVKEENYLPILKSE